MTTFSSSVAIHCWRRKLSHEFAAPFGSSFLSERFSRKPQSAHLQPRSHTCKSSSRSVKTRSFWTSSSSTRKMKSRRCSARCQFHDKALCICASVVIRIFLPQRHSGTENNCKLRTSVFQNVKPKAVSVSTETLVRVEAGAGRQLPLVLQPGVAGVNLVDWTRSNASMIEGLLAEHG